MPPYEPEPDTDDEEIQRQTSLTRSSLAISPPAAASTSRPARGSRTLSQHNTRLRQPASSGNDHGHRSSFYNESSVQDVSAAGDELLTHDIIPTDHGPSPSPARSVVERQQRKPQRQSARLQNITQPDHLYDMKLHPDIDKVCKPALYKRRTGQAAFSDNDSWSSATWLDAQSTPSSAAYSVTGTDDAELYTSGRRVTLPDTRLPDPKATRRSLRFAARKFVMYNTKHHPDDAHLPGRRQQHVQYVSELRESGIAVEQTRQQSQSTEVGEDPIEVANEDSQSEIADSVGEPAEDLLMQDQDPVHDLASLLNFADPSVEASADIEPAEQPPSPMIGAGRAALSVGIEDHTHTGNGSASSAAEDLDTSILQPHKPASPFRPGSKDVVLAPALDLSALIQRMGQATPAEMAQIRAVFSQGSSNVAMTPSTPQSTDNVQPLDASDLVDHQRDFPIPPQDFQPTQEPPTTSWRGGYTSVSLPIGMHADTNARNHNPTSSGDDESAELEELPAALQTKPACMSQQIARLIRSPASSSQPIPRQASTKQSQAGPHDKDNEDETWPSWTPRTQQSSSSAEPRGGSAESINSVATRSSAATSVTWSASGQDHPPKSSEMPDNTQDTVHSERQTTKQVSKSSLQSGGGIASGGALTSSPKKYYGKRSHIQAFTDED